MATLILTAVGTALGGPLGGAIGSLIGQSFDQQLFGSANRGPRLGGDRPDVNLRHADPAHLRNHARRRQRHLGD